MFGILNLAGYSATKEDTLTFTSDQCQNKVCSAVKDFDHSTQTTMYIHYPFFQTSYYVYSKGLSFNGILKKYSYLTDNFECYPVNTFQQYFDVMSLLNLTTTPANPQALRVIKLVSQVGLNEQIKPCGLKAALASRIGRWSVTYENGTSLPSEVMDTEHLVDQRYINAVQNSSDDFVDVKSGSFLSWYLPQIPGFGTKLVVAIFPSGLKGKMNISFDYSRIN